MSVKPAFSYYGGKQRMASKIVPLIPKHTVYVEPFAGGCAVLFKKPWPEVTNSNHYREVINDTNGDLVHFYKMLRDRGKELARAGCLTPYSRQEHAERNDLTDCDIERARKWFVNISMSFANHLNGVWGVGKTGCNEAVRWLNKCSNLLNVTTRLQGVHIECKDAIDVIKQWDSPHTFFYCDPPYPNTRQGHYSGYGSGDFNELVQTLGDIKGSFLLSCYPTEGMPANWERFQFAATMSAARNAKNNKRTEVVYRKISTAPLSPAIKKIYDSGKLDCFTGHVGQIV